MQFVNQLLEIKGRTVWWVTPETSVYDALVLMTDQNVGAVLVLEADRLVGIVSERDYARKVILKGKTSKGTPVKEIMSTEVFCVFPEQSVEECMVLMTNKRVRHLPVLKNSKLVGIISIGDVVKAIISEQEFTIRQLESYITGSAAAPTSL